MKKMDMAEVHAKVAYKTAMEAIRSLKKITKDLVKINKVVSNLNTR
jgi:hypothetical protein